MADWKRCPTGRNSASRCSTVNQYNTKLAHTEFSIEVTIPGNGSIYSRLTIIYFGVLCHKYSTLSTINTLVNG